MKKLGKKNTVQEGTLIAFASCDCTPDCRMLPCSCTGTSVDATVSAQNFARLFTVANAGKELCNNKLYK